jgi:hypothetical protein
MPEASLAEEIEKLSNVPQRLELQGSSRKFISPYFFSSNLESASKA